MVVVVRTRTGPTGRAATCSPSSSATSARCGMLIVVTFRSDELHRTHPLRPLLAELTRIDWVERPELPRLTRGQAEELAAAVLGQCPPTASPTGSTSGPRATRCSPRSCSPARTAGDGSPTRCADLLLQAVRRLPEDTQEVLRVASAGSGGPATPLLARVTAGRGELTAAFCARRHRQRAGDDGRRIRVPARADPGGRARGPAAGRARPCTPGSPRRSTPTRRSSPRGGRTSRRRTTGTRPTTRGDQCPRRVVGGMPVMRLLDARSPLGDERRFGVDRLGVPGMHLPVLSRQQVLVDRLADQRVPERVAVGRRDQHVAGDGRAQHAGQVRFAAAGPPVRVARGWCCRCPRWPPAALPASHPATAGPPAAAGPPASRGLPPPGRPRSTAAPR